MRIRRWSAALALLLVAATLSGCGLRSRRGPAAGRQGVELRVTNHNWSLVVVYAMRNGTRWRLGDVPTMGTRTFSLDRTTGMGPGGVEILVDPLGSSEAFLTDQVTVGPGETIVLRVENNLSHSTYSVRGS
jgi:hypothetical protein